MDYKHKHPFYLKGHKKLQHIDLQYVGVLILWRCRGSNPGPNEEIISFLHAYS